MFRFMHSLGQSHAVININREMLVTHSHVFAEIQESTHFSFVRFHSQTSRAEMSLTNGGKPKRVCCMENVKESIASSSNINHLKFH